jgi:hypothetical protein
LQDLHTVRILYWLPEIATVSVQTANQLPIKNPPYNEIYLNTASEPESGRGGVLDHADQSVCFGVLPKHVMRRLRPIFTACCAAIMLAFAVNKV